MNFFNIVTRVFAVIGGLVLIVGTVGANGAPQEAAAGIAIALAVLPYVIFRTLQITNDAFESKVRYAAILKRLDNLQERQEATSTDTQVKCPDCRELVLKDARICKHCGCALVPQ